MSGQAGQGRAGGRVAIVGGGLAGMAAAAVLAEQGCKVDLFEQRRHLGGRVGSFCNPATGLLVDRCMHVSMGCCTNFLDFIDRLGVADCFSRQRELHFVGPEGQVCRFGSWPWLPAPLHLLPGFARLRYLTLGERLSIGRCLLRLGRLDPNVCQEETAGDWLRRQGQSQRVLDRFWSVVVVSALGETVDRASVTMARKVFLDGFMRSARGYEVLLPRPPLREIFDRRAGERLRELGVALRCGQAVRSIEMGSNRAEALQLASGERCPFDDFVIAVPWRSIDRLLTPDQLSRLAPGLKLEEIESAAIAAVHLWFDRPITSLPHAALVGRLSQWMFSHGRTEAPSHSGKSLFHYQIVISAANRLGVVRKDLLEQVLTDLRAVWPETKGARLLHHRIAIERDAVFSTAPATLRARPGNATKERNVFLAGDWTRSAWPATMEAAVLSGYNAARALLREGHGRGWPVDGLKPSWLARLFFLSEERGLG